MEHSVPLTVTLRTEHADLGSLERVIDGALAEAGRTLWAELLRVLEAALPVPATCPCGGTLKANGRAPRRLVTLAGEVDLRRRRFRCRACRTEIVPLDAALGLEPRIQHSLGVRERALWLVTELSYAKTATTLDELRRLPVSHGELHRWVAQEGARIELAIAAETEAILGDQPTRAPAGRTPGDVWVQADGTMIHGRTGADATAPVGRSTLAGRGSEPGSHRNDGTGAGACGEAGGSAGLKVCRVPAKHALHLLPRQGSPRGTHGLCLGAGHELCTSPRP